jgi:tetratricopeptide (TPR) repeat protein
MKQPCTGTSAQQAQGCAPPPQVAELPAKTTLFAGSTLGRAGCPDPAFHTKVGRLLMALVAVVLCEVAFAAPRVPQDDATVLEHVPAVAATQKLAPVRMRLAAHPEDLSSALALAQGYLDIGRANADPRFVSYAEATLAPWLQRPMPDASVLTLAATTRQYLHHFDEALGLLDRAIARERFNGQAWLTKASILQVEGRFEEARQACRPLIESSGQLIALTCLTAVNSLTGKLDASYRSLRQVFRDDPRLGTTVRLWILDELAEMAVRLGKDTDAEDYYRAALAVNPADGYTQGEYADLLLRQQRGSEVVQLLRSEEQQDNLLLRLAIAATQLHSVDAQRWSGLFQARYEAARRDGDFTHLREQARYLLEVRGDCAAAVSLAARNWIVQREPADVRLYWAAATAAGRQDGLQTIRDWVRQTRYEDAVLGSGLLGELSHTVAGR